MDEFFVEEKSNIDRLLDFLVFLAVFAVTIFLILDIMGVNNVGDIDIQSINNVYFWVNIVVFIIFLADLVRLWNRSDDAKDFFKHNWLDVLATIPFELIAFAVGAFQPPKTAQAFGIVKWFRVAKLTGVARVQKISRISKISKEFKAASHLKKESEEYKKKHRL